MRLTAGTIRDFFFHQIKKILSRKSEQREHELKKFKLYHKSFTFNSFFFDLFILMFNSEYLKYIAFKKLIRLLNNTVILIL